MERFFTILTNLGLAAEAAAAGSGIPVELAEMALGDGLDGAYYEPYPEQTALKHEVYRAPLYSLRHDGENPYQYIAEINIPGDAPYFMVREAGLYTASGELYAVAKHPLIEKPLITSGADFNLSVEMVFAVSNADTIQLVIDPDQIITIDDSMPPTGNTGTPATLFSWLAHMIKSITGKASWRTAPAITLQGAYTHGERQDNPHQVTYQQSGAAAAGHSHTGVYLPIGGTAMDSDKLNGYAGSWYVPPGALMGFARSTAPDGWLAADGSAVSRVTYAALFAAIGTVWGVGDGATTFGLPDLRGEFERGWDNGRGIDADRVFGSSQLDQIQNITGSFGIDDRAATIATGAFSKGLVGKDVASDGGGTGYDMFFDASLVVRAGTETRPRNVAVLKCIKY